MWHKSEERQMPSARTRTVIDRGQVQYRLWIARSKCTVIGFAKERKKTGSRRNKVPTPFPTLLGQEKLGESLYRQSPGQQQHKVMFEHLKRTWRFTLAKKELTP